MRDLKLETFNGCPICLKSVCDENHFNKLTKEAVHEVGELIAENNRLEQERRAKPATIGDVEDAIQRLKDSLSSL